MAQQKRWTAPEIRRYGTFETATQAKPHKDFGSGDAITFQGIHTVSTS